MRAEPEDAGATAAPGRCQPGARARSRLPGRPGGAIRLARLSELPAVWRLGAECFADEALPATVLGQYLTDRRSAILIAQHGPDLAGFAVLRVARDHGRSAGVIVSLGVAAVHRRNGLGRRLLREAHRWCRQAGAESIRLDVAQDNLAALALYTGQGYRVAGMLPHYYGVGRDGLRMERSALRRTVRRPSH